MKVEVIGHETQRSRPEHEEMPRTYWPVQLDMEAAREFGCMVAVLKQENRR